MSYYFRLQLRIVKRKLRAFGIHPNLALFLIILLFALISYLLFQRTTYAPYILMVFGIFTSKSLDDSSKIDFLKLNFSKKQVFKIRLWEHYVFIIPIVIVLLITFNYWQALLLIVLIPFLAKININMGAVLNIPSPYKKYPFEFTVGFRKFILLIIIAYIVGFTGCIVGNYNIAIFGLMLLAFSMMNYYSLPEPSIIIWEDIRSASQLLHYKLLVGLRYFSITCLPLLILIFSFYPTYWVYTIMWMAIVIIYFLFFILMKYDAYPDQMNLPHTIYFIASLVIPPLVLIFAFKFYKNALNNIKINLR